MVEGPGATKNARNARKLVGCRLASIEGVDGVPVGARLAEVLCLGKEVWLIFASEAAAATGDVSDDDVVDLCGESDKEDDVIDLTSEKTTVPPGRRRRRRSRSTRCASTSA